MNGRSCAWDEVELGIRVAASCGWGIVTSGFERASSHEGYDSMADAERVDRSAGSPKQASSSSRSVSLFSFFIT
jgi:hypothetical protein